MAEEIGRGNLDVIIERADANGDEIARLGRRINEMVRGVRLYGEILPSAVKLPTRSSVERVFVQR